MLKQARSAQYSCKGDCCLGFFKQILDKTSEGSNMTSYLLGNKGAHIYNGNGLLQCSDCKKRYKSSSTLENHKCSYCKKCLKVYSSYQKYLQHKCDGKNDELEQKKNHMKESSCKKNEGHLECKFCSKTYKTDTTFRNHKCTYCVNCQTVYSTYQRLLTHHCSEKKKFQEMFEDITKVKHQPIQSVTTSYTMVGTVGTFIPDEVICDALQMIREYTGSQYHGHILPAEMLLFLDDPSQARPPVPNNEFSINIHNLGNHWVTSVYNPHMQRILVYDSLHRIEHITQIIPQLKLLYGSSMLSKVDFIPVTQQGTDPACGAFAVAFAFSYCLGITPSSQNFDISLIRNHLEQCLKTRKILAFPTHSCQRIDIIEDHDIEMKRNYEKKKEKERERLKHKRKNEDYKKQENERKHNAENRERESEHKQEKRTSEAFRKQENEKKHNIENRKKASQHMKENRTREAFRKQENERKHNIENRKKESEHKKENRTSDAFRKQENERKHNIENRKKASQHMKENRTSKAFRKQENERKHNIENRKKASQHMKENRTSEAFRKQENERKRNIENRKKESEHKKEKRTSGGFRKQENERKRLNSVGRRAEKLHKAKLRTTLSFRKMENNRKKNMTQRYHEKEHKQIVRQDFAYRHLENKRKKQKQNLSLKQLEMKFHESVANGPLYICTCCDQMMYRESVRIVPKLAKIPEDLKCKTLTGVKSVGNKEWVCHTCFSAIKKQKLPSCAKANLMEFPKIPSELDLTHMEERLIAPRIPFMSIHQLPRGGQLSLCGNVVNVPANVNKTILKLPRNRDENECIPVKLKRKLSYKHHVEFRNVRPQRVLNAVNWLIGNSQLFQDEGVTINPDWNPDEEPGEDNNDQDRDEETDKEVDNVTGKEIDNEMGKETERECDSETDKEIDKEAEKETDKEMHKRTDKGPDQETEKDPWNETEDVPIGTLDTLLVPQDPTNDAHQVYSFAPAEGHTPVSIFMDKNAEELAFPTIFCGQPRPENKDRPTKVSYGDICKSELRRSDRRIAKNVANIFFKYKKLQTKHILDKANLCIRKTKGNQDLTARFLKSKTNVDQLCRHDEGFRIFKDLRGSPPYWEQSKKDIFAMIRKLGIPTWFASFSSAETRWSHLLNILSQSLHGKTLSNEEIAELSWFEKAELIKNDPVTCTRHFDHQVKTFINSVLFSSQHPIGKVTDFFYKVEFQMRGSPHIHMLIWVEDSPKLDDTEESQAAVVAFIDRYITCHRNKKIEDLVDVQEHSHSRTCKKKNKNECRFNFPQPPMQRTCILDPLDGEISDDDKEKHKANWGKIQKILDDMKTGKDIDISEFLKQLSLSKEDYILAIRSSLTSARIFLKRRVSEIRINNYSSILLRCWRANMDIQFVMDPYACAMYIVTYITKSQRGMSLLLLNAAKEAREGNLNIRQQVKAIGHKFLTHVEVSAQEAVYFILQLPLRHSSRDVMFVNTSPENERVVLLKNFKLIQQLPDDSTEVETSNMIKRYAKRPKALEDICLADFCSWFKVEYKGRAKPVEEDSFEQTSKDVDQTSHEYKCADGTILKKRQQSIVIRYVRYNQEMDSENYFREVLMLFYPWRKENAIKNGFDSFQEKFQEIVKTSDIEDKMLEYNHNWYELDTAVKDLEHRKDENMDDEWDRIAPAAQQVEREDEEEGVQESDIFPVFAAPTEDITDFSEIYQGDSFTERAEHLTNFILDTDYLKLVEKLNAEQRQFFLHVIHHLKTDKKPVYFFLTGGAGVGKTVVVTAIYQAMLRFYNKGPENNPDEPKILLAAPTGIAAYLIKGNTLHTLFKIPINQGLQYKPLSSDKLNTLHCQFQNVKLLIIDEISMVGNQMLAFIHQRLQQIMGSSKLFGGLSVIAVGDLYQLKPVFDSWVFENLDEDYGPLATNLWVENFKFFQLNKIMRQRDSADFALLLNRLRVCKHTKEDIKLLKSRQIPRNLLHPDYPLYTPHIYTTNKLVDQHNDLVYDLSDSNKKVAVTAKDVVLGDVSQQVKEKVRNSIPKKPSKTMGLFQHYKSAIGLRNELTCNIDVSDGLANGAGCILKAVGPVTPDGKISYLWVQFEDENVGKKCRENNNQLYTSGIDKRWTPIFKVKRQFKVGRWKSVMVMREQFPLRSAGAKTNYKCQGTTMEEAVVDFAGKTFPHAHYVALSRVKTLDKLSVRTLKEKSIRTSPEVDIEMQRLATDMALIPYLSTYVNSDAPCFKVLFHNVRSLHKHVKDIQTDETYSSSDIIILLETKLKNADNSENYAIPNMNLYRFDCSVSEGDRSPYGIAVYSKHEIPSSAFQHKVVRTTAGTVIEMVGFQLKTNLPEQNILKIAAIYASPKAKWTELSKFLQQSQSYYHQTEDQTVILGGDFNIDLLSKPNHPILKTVKLQQVVKNATTDNNSLLDHIYISDTRYKFTSGVLESYFSDHKPVYTILQPE